jgi:hypothetical protein
MTLPFAEIAHQPGVMRYGTVNNSQTKRGISANGRNVIPYIRIQKRIMKNLKNRASTICLLALACSGYAAAPANAADNPMDYIGIAHNIYLDCLEKSESQSVSPLIRIVEECGFDAGMSTDELVKRYQGMIEMDPRLPITQRMAPYRDQYTRYQFSFFERIEKIAAISRSLSEADAMFAKLEDEAIAHLSVKNAADRSVLATLSTVRYSIRYWSTANLSGGSETARWPKWIRVVTLALVDGAGVAIGGLPGGAGASTMGSLLLNEIDPPPQEE